MNGRRSPTTDGAVRAHPPCKHSEGTSNELMDDVSKGDPINNHISKNEKENKNCKLKNKQIKPFDISTSNFSELPFFTNNKCSTSAQDSLGSESNDVDMAGTTIHRMTSFPLPQLSTTRSLIGEHAKVNSLISNNTPTPRNRVHIDARNTITPRSDFLGPTLSPCDLAVTTNNYPSPHLLNDPPPEVDPTATLSDFNPNLIHANPSTSSSLPKVDNNLGQTIVIPIDSIIIDLPIIAKNAKSSLFRLPKENKC